MAAPDPRQHPFRDDLAAAYLEGQVEAPIFREPERRMVTKPVADMMHRPEWTDRVSQLRYGEDVDVYDIADGFAWVQNLSDRYVGYVDAGSVGPCEQASHHVSAMAAPVYPRPDMKSFGWMTLPHLSGVKLGGEEGDFRETPLGWIHKAHIGPVKKPDPVAVVEDYLGVPYLWGGRSSFGLDCSALVQVMMSAHSPDLPCPRDSDMQAGLGEHIAALQRGDLVFWEGHVGIMRSETELLHANAHHMMVASEPLADAIARIERVEGKSPTGSRRVL